MVAHTQSAPSRCNDPELHLDVWLSSICSGFSPEEEALIRRACDCACEVHGDSRRQAGDTYLHHVLTVATILADMDMDDKAIAAGILHEVVERTPMTAEQLEEQFGDSVARLVKGANRISGIAARREEPEAEDAHDRAEDLRKLLLAVIEDVRVIFLKLADCLHNVRSLRDFPGPKADQIARDARDIYAPLANRLGIWQIKWELEDLIFRYFEPEAYSELAKSLDGRRVEREEYISEVITHLRKTLDAAGIQHKINGRPKHLYSIWKKMRSKSLTIEQLFDIRAVRVLVDSVPTCYTALGVVHSQWQPVPGEFDDYIANPKKNGYQSLHTAVFGPNGRTVEVQIRTKEMHQHAELGVAAHWRYKEGSRFDRAIEERIGWLRQLVESRDHEGESLVEQLSIDVADERVYVLTPRGEVVDLPYGSTPLDFAFAVHSEVGLRCRGAKVDGHIVSLSHCLKTGETVEALVGSKAQPSRNWLIPHLGYLHTSRARARVRQWFNQQNLADNIQTGKAALDHEIKQLGLVHIDEDALMQRFHKDSMDEVYASIGRGAINEVQIAAALESQVLPPAPAQPDQLPPVRKPAAKVAGQGVFVHGVGDLLVQMAGCCHPVPYDPIIGYITRGRGVTVHREDCDSIARMDDSERARLIDVSWGQSQDAVYPVEIRVHSYDRPGLLRDITVALGAEHVNVIGANTFSNKKDSTAEFLLKLEIANAAQLSRVLARIGQLPNVMEVSRIGS